MAIVQLEFHMRVCNGLAGQHGNSELVLLFIAATIVEAGKDKKNPDDFAQALDSVLGDFAFPDVLLLDVWNAIGDVKSG